MYQLFLPYCRILSENVDVLSFQSIRQLLRRATSSTCPQSVNIPWKSGKWLLFRGSKYLVHACSFTWKYHENLGNVYYPESRTVLFTFTAVNIPWSCSLGITVTVQIFERKVLSNKRLKSNLSCFVTTPYLLYTCQICVLLWHIVYYCILLSIIVQIIDKPCMVFSEYELSSFVEYHRTTYSDHSYGIIELNNFPDRWWHYSPLCHN